MAQVLLVDGDEPLREAVAQAIAVVGHKVVAVPKAEAVNTALLKTLRPNLAIVELALPGMTGDHLCLALQKVKSALKLKVILVSGGDEKDLVKRARAAQADGFATKNFLIHHPIDFVTAFGPESEAARQAASASAPVALGSLMSPPKIAPMQATPSPHPTRPVVSPVNGRVACHLPVTGFDSASSPFNGMIQSLWAKGAEVVTSVTPAVGAPMNLGFAAEGGQVQVQTKVAKVQSGGAGRFVSVTFEFTAMGPQTQERIQALLGKLAAGTVR